MQLTHHDPSVGKMHEGLGIEVKAVNITSVKL